jgi:hypothetical protein
MNGQTSLEAVPVRTKGFLTNVLLDRRCDTTTPSLYIMWALLGVFKTTATTVANEDDDQSSRLVRIVRDCCARPYHESTMTQKP